MITYENWERPIGALGNDRRDVTWRLLRCHGGHKDYCPSLWTKSKHNISCDSQSLDFMIMSNFLHFTFFTIFPDSTYFNDLEQVWPKSPFHLTNYKRAVIKMNLLVKTLKTMYFFSIGIMKCIGKKCKKKQSFFMRGGLWFLLGITLS